MTDNNYVITDEQIIQALSSSGYLMEQEVATELERLGFFVDTNVAFTDADEGKSREIDVIGYRRIATDLPPTAFAGVQVICECKNSKTPYFFVTRPKNSMDAQYTPAEFVFPMNAFEWMDIKDRKKERQYTANSAFHRLKLADFHHYFSDTHKAVQFGVLSRKQNKLVAEHAHIFDGIFFPLIKAVEVQRQKAGEIAHELSEGNQPNVWIRLLVPLVVVSSDLYQIDSSVVPPLVSKQPYMTFIRDVQTASIKGRFMVIFVQQQSLELYLNEVLKPITDEISRLLKADWKVFLPKKL